MTESLIPNTFTQRFSITSIGEFIAALMSILFILAGILFFIYFVWGGLEWILSGGKQDGIDKAKARIIAAFVGLTIVSLTYAAITYIQYFFGIKIIGEFPIPIPY